MARVRRAPDTCCKCGGPAPWEKALTCFVVRLGDEWIERFTYPASTSTADKAWEKSPGIRVAQCVKAHLGKGAPYRWPATGEDSARFTARRIEGAEHARLCGACAASFSKDAHTSK